MDGKYQTPTTPNVMNIGGLGFVCQAFQKDFGSKANLFAKTHQKAERLYNFFDHHPVLNPAVAKGKGRSESVIVVDGPEEYFADMHQRLAKEGIQVGKGYGGAKTRQIRIGNFPVHTISDVENLLGKIEKK
jgi:phosphoserine aminotransferase